MADEPSDCPGCGVLPGRRHEADCEVELCPACGWQWLSCGCGKTTEEAERTPWTGLLPGVAECREYGFWSRLTPDRGWVRCAADDPGAFEDLNRLGTDCEWDRSKQRWVLLPPAEEPLPPTAVG